VRLTGWAKASRLIRIDKRAAEGKNPWLHLGVGQSIGEEWTYLELEADVANTVRTVEVALEVIPYGTTYWDEVILTQDEK
jgi:hypothetical protein